MKNLLKTISLLVLMGFTEINPLNSELQTVSVKNFNDSVGRLIPMDKKVLSKTEVYYTFGNRVAGDKLVASGFKNEFKPGTTSYAVKIRYPSYGYGKRVTFAYLRVSQTNTEGRAYIVDGGIFKFTITVVLEGYNTTQFAWSADIYGQNF